MQAVFCLCRHADEQSPRRRLLVHTRQRVRGRSPYLIDIRDLDQWIELGCTAAHQMHQLPDHLVANTEVLPCFGYVQQAPLDRSLNPGARCRNRAHISSHDSAMTAG
jgi:hypothetical protein